MEKFLKNKDEIIAWLSDYRILNPELIPDEKYGYVVNIQEPFNASHRKLEFVPVKFKTTRFFNISNNKLKSLEFAPDEVLGDFDVSNNLLTSLKGSPKKVEKFICFNNLINSYEFGPQEIQHIDCRGNKLESFEYFPTKIFYLNCSSNQIKEFGKYLETVVILDCSNNLLESLEDMPEVKNFTCNYNQLINFKGLKAGVSNKFIHNRLLSFEGCPSEINGDIDVSSNFIKSFEFLGEFITNLNCSDNKIEDFKFLPENVKKIELINNPVKEKYKFNSIEDIYEILAIEKSHNNLSENLKIKSLQNKKSSKI